MNDRHVVTATAGALAYSWESERRLSELRHGESSDESLLEGHPRSLGGIEVDDAKVGVSDVSHRLSNLVSLFELLVDSGQMFDNSDALLPRLIPFRHRNRVALVIGAASSEKGRA